MRTLQSTIVALGGAAILFVALAAPVLAADPTAYLAEMPTTDQVAAKIQGSDAFDTAARQYAAFDRLDSMVDELIGDRLFANKATDAELALRRTYHDAYLGVQGTLLASLPEGDRVNRADTRYGQWWALVAAYCCKDGNASDPYHNAAFSDTLLKAFFSASFRSSYAKIHAVTVANQHEVVTPGPQIQERAPGPDTSRIPIAFFLILLNMGLFGAGAAGGYRRRRTD